MKLKGHIFLDLDRLDYIEAAEPLLICKKKAYSAFCLQLPAKINFNLKLTLCWTLHMFGDKSCIVHRAGRDVRGEESALCDLTKSHFTKACLLAQIF